MSEEWTENGVQHLIVYSYDASGYPISMTYRKSADAAAAAEVYFLATNLQGDVTYIYDIDGNRVVTYNYDAWGNILSISGTKASTIGRYNPFRYRSYYYDNETGFYYLNSRYYDPASGRFLNADGQLNDGLLGYNLFAYCGNNPINRADPTGEAWWHWVIGAAVVVGFGVLTVATCGGSVALAAASVGLVANGIAAATTATTIAAAAFIGSSTVYGMAVLSAVFTSSSVQEFNDQGNWGTVISTAGGAFFGGTCAYLGTKGSNTSQSTAKSKVESTIKNDIVDLPRTGSALKSDQYHAFPNIVDNYAGYATKTPISNGTLYQLLGSLNGTVGRFEWIIQNQQVTHRYFVPGGGINGIPIIP